MSHFEKAVEKETIYTGRIFCVHKYQVELENKNTTLREVVEHHGGSCVVAVNPEGELLMVRQFRFPAGEELWELPAGKLERGEDPMAAAARELEEETGYTAEALTLLTKMLPTPAYCTEVIYIYQARGLKKTAQRLDEDEFLSLVPVPFEKALAMVRAGEITDAKSQVGILLAAINGGIRPAEEKA